MKEEVCSICKELKKVHTRNENKEAVCIKCYSKFYQKKEICVVCGELKTTKKRDENKNSICASCYKKEFQPKRKCDICKKIKIVYKMNNDKPICATCYKREFQPKEICSICGELKTVNSHIDNKPICPTCYKTPIEECSMCHKEKEVWRRIDDKPYCMGCNATYKRKTDNDFYIREKVRKRVRAALNLYTKEGKIQESRKYGIDYLGIINYLGKCPGEFKDYHIDHIFPLVAFDLNNKKQLEAAFAPENHQWLTVKENRVKKDNYDENLFKEYLKKYGC